MGMKSVFFENLPNPDFRLKNVNAVGTCKEVMKAKAVVAINSYGR